MNLELNAGSEQPKNERHAWAWPDTTYPLFRKKQKQPLALFRIQPGETAEQFAERVVKTTNQLIAMHQCRN